MSQPSFFAELQRRHVYKVGAMYCVAGWLLVQIATQVFPFFDISNAAVRWVVIAVVAGLPATLVLAWLFDITPQGIVRTPDAPAAETPAATTQRRGMERRLNYVLGALLALGAGYVALEHTLLRSAAPAGGGDKSVAVLPFDNLSDDKANAYFATGVQDQVLTQLAKIGALRVISRTSTEQYAARPPSVAEIARQLGVANILEGSVQKSGDAVRINVQLIRADGDAHLWAETYDRKLDNIFGVESEVAGAIAQALNAKLSGAEQQELAARPTRNAEAWDDYLHGLVLFNRGESQADIADAEQSLGKAVRLDPDFALAWALLSQVHAVQVIELWDASDQRRDAAREALRQALRLQPDAVETRIAQAYCDFWVERDYDAARRIFEQVRQQALNNSDIPFALALIARRQGRWDDSLANFEQAMALDPRNVETLTQAAYTAAGVARFALAQRYLERAQDAAPQSGVVSIARAIVAQMQGRLDDAERALAQAPPDGSDALPVMVAVFQNLLRHRYAEGIALTRRMLGKLDAASSRERSLYAFSLGEFQRLSGDAGGARASYELAQEQMAAVLRQQPHNIDLLDLQALVQARLGNRKAAMEFYQSAVQAMPAGGDAMFNATNLNTLARLQAQFGDRDAALATLRRMRDMPDFNAVGKPPITPATLRLDPDWDGLRDDPRFQALLADRP